MWKSSSGWLHLGQGSLIVAAFSPPSPSSRKVDTSWRFCRSTEGKAEGCERVTTVRLSYTSASCPVPHAPHLMTSSSDTMSSRLPQALQNSSEPILSGRHCVCCISCESYDVIRERRTRSRPWSHGDRADWGGRCIGWWSKPQASCCTQRTEKKNTAGGTEYSAFAPRPITACNRPFLHSGAPSAHPSARSSRTHIVPSTRNNAVIFGTFSYVSLSVVPIDL